MHAGNPVGPTAVLVNIAPVGRTAVSAILAPVGRTALSAIPAPVGRTALSASIIVPVRLLRNLIPVLVLLLLLTSCGMFTGTPHATRRAVGTASMPPAASELEAALTAELARLGKSPSDSTPHAPAGTTNAVFDLACAVVDPDGEPDGEGGGELPPTGITLVWTERLLGDYNLDGQVNAGDLAPLGINWQQAVQYDAASAHGGIAYWPQGSAVDDGGSPYPAPPATGSGARNWRLARIDAQSDGVLDVKDVTPIAVHWCEQSSGYRVYVKLPGGTEFLLVPEDGSTPHQPSAGEVTLPRSSAFPAGKSSADPTRPVRFGCTYEDGGHGGPPHGLPEGRYEYYVTAYDAATDSEGPASAHVVLDITGGVANQPPVAVLTVSPDFAGAPAVITFDASQSHDPDGSIKEYRWDFDADGEVDWSTADETVPEQSSNGEVDTITPGEAPGVGLPPTSVTVTYHQGHAQYMYPRVTVVDDKDGTAMQPVKLGVSGWVKELLCSELEAYDPPGEEIRAFPTDIQLHPESGELCFVCTGDGIDETWGPPWPKGLYFLTRHGDGTWDKEIACAGDDPILRPNAVFYMGFLAWQSNGQPVILFNEFNSSQNNLRLLSAFRQTDGSWVVAVVRECTHWYGVGACSISQSAPGEFLVYIGEYTGEAEPDGDNAQHFYIAHYVDSDMELWDTGWDTADGRLWPNSMSTDKSGIPILALHYYGESSHELWQRRRLSDGSWINERLDAGLPILDNLRTDPKVILEKADGTLGIAVARNWHKSGLDWRFQMCCAIGQPGNLTLIPIRDYWDGEEMDFSSTPQGFSLFTNDYDKHLPDHKEGLHHDLISTDGSVVSELLYQVDTDDVIGSGTSFQDAAYDAAGHCYALAWIGGGDYYEDNGEGILSAKLVVMLCTRVDPRLP